MFTFFPEYAFKMSLSVRKSLHILNKFKQFFVPDFQCSLARHSTSVSNFINFRSFSSQSTAIFHGNYHSCFKSQAIVKNSVNNLFYCNDILLPKYSQFFISWRYVSNSGKDLKVPIIPKKKVKKTSPPDPEVNSLLILLGSYIQHCVQFKK